MGDNDNSSTLPSSFSKPNAIKLPFALDKGKWITLNKTLDCILKIKFPPNKRNTLPLEELAREIPEFLYKNLSEIYGTKPITVHKSTKKKKKNAPISVGVYKKKKKKKKKK